MYVCMYVCLLAMIELMAKRGRESGSQVLGVTACLCSLKYWVLVPKHAVCMHVTGTVYYCVAG